MHGEGIRGRHELLERRSKKADSIVNGQQVQTLVSTETPLQFDYYQVGTAPATCARVPRCRVLTAHPTRAAPFLPAGQDPRPPRESGRGSCWSFPSPLTILHPLLLCCALRLAATLCGCVLSGAMREQGIRRTRRRSGRGCA
eukprot:1117500-Rhodomonas_salina.4